MKLSESIKSDPLFDHYKQETFLIANTRDLADVVNALERRIEALESSFHVHMAWDVHRIWKPEESRREEPKKLAEILSETCWIFQGSETKSIPHWGVAAKIAIEAVERVIRDLGECGYISGATEDTIKRILREKLL